MTEILQFILMVLIVINSIIWTGISILILYHLWDYTKNKTDFKKLWPTSWIKMNPWI